jgi:hypothetical protein
MQSLTNRALFVVCANELGEAIPVEYLQGDVYYF